MKKKLYQNPEMEIFKLNQKSTLLLASCDTKAPGCLGDGCDDGD